MSLDHTLLPQILARWPASCHGTAAETRHRGFSGAVIVRVRTDCGDFCLRGWPADAPSPDRLRGLHRLLTHVYETGVTQVPVPLPALDGETLIAAFDRCWQLEPWKPGVADFHLQPSDARLENAMEVLSAFHRATSSFEPDSGERRWFGRNPAGIPPSITERRRQLRDWSPEKIERVRQALSTDSSEFARLGREALKHATRLAPVVAAQLDAAASQSVPLGPCIRDVWHDHLLFTGDDVTGLIDLAACRTDHVATDLARLLGSFCGDDRNRWDQALAAYQNRRALSLPELGLIPILDRSGVLLSGMLWLERRYLRQDRMAELERVCMRLEAIVGRLERMS
jgi:Ser/Thr protein kinase RdoA (MazF antagonist)